MSDYFVPILKDTFPMLGKKFKGDACASLLYMYLLSYQSNKNGLCYPSFRKLSVDAGMALSTVQAKIKTLEKAGLIEIIRGEKNSFSYRILTPDGFDQKKYKKELKELREKEKKKEEAQEQQGQEIQTQEDEEDIPF